MENNSAEHVIDSLADNDEIMATASTVSKSESSSAMDITTDALCMDHHMETVSATDGTHKTEGSRKRDEPVVIIKDDSSCDVSEELLGEGSFGKVFPGIYQGNRVAVKQIPLRKVDMREEENMHKLERHPNVVKFFEAATVGDYRCVEHIYILKACKNIYTIIN